MVEVVDGHRPEAAGTFELQVDAGVGVCRRTDRAPDLACSVRALGSTYLGGVNWTTLAGADRVQERTRGALAIADGLFRCDRAPWPAFYF